jgi:hypothetical protein
MGELECKVEFLIEGKSVSLVFKKVRGRKPLKLSQAKEVAVFLKAYETKIIEKWQQVFIRNQQVACEVIRKRLARK